MESAPKPPTPKVLLAASTLAWFSFIFAVFSWFALIRELGHAGKLYHPLYVVLLLVAIFYGFGGWGLARRIRAGGVVCLAAAAVNFGLHLVYPVPVAPLILLINIALLVLIVSGWKHLKGKGEV